MAYILTPRDADCDTPNTLQHLFKNNQNWVAKMQAEDAEYFTRLKDQQKPQYLWIGCSDSRVPANQITGLPPGEVFVHRNIANVVVHTDLNCLSVIQFAVEVLQIRHIMVVGHYGCSGVGAALMSKRIGLADNWLRHIRDVHDQHIALIKRCAQGAEQHACLVELNAIEQAVHVCSTTIVQDAWERNQDLTVHAWVYGVHDGHLRNLGLNASSQDSLERTYKKCIEKQQAKLDGVGENP